MNKINARFLVGIGWKVAVFLLCYDKLFVPLTVVMHPQGRHVQRQKQMKSWP